MPIEDLDDDALADMANDPRGDDAYAVSCAALMPPLPSTPPVGDDWEVRFRVTQKEIEKLTPGELPSLSPLFNEEDGEDTAEGADDAEGEPAGWRAHPWPFLYPDACAAPESPWQLKITPAMLPPAPSLYDRYFKWASKATDAPRPLHWAALTTSLGAVLGPAHRIAAGDDWVAPNLYTLLVVESGQRKSYTIDLITRLLPPDLLCSALPVSAAAFHDMIEQDSWLMLTLDEAGALFRTLGSGTSWTQTLSHYMVRAYDGKPLEVRTHKDGARAAQVEFMAFLGATTEDSLRAMPPKELRQVMLGGLLSRCLVCTGHVEATEKPKHEALRSARRFAERLQTYCAQLHHAAPPKPTSNKIKRAFHRYRLSHAARVELWRWSEQLGTQPPSPTLGGTWRRLGLYAKKIALIYHIAQGRGPDEEIDVPTFVAAARVVSYYLVPAFRWFADRTGETQYQDQCNRLLDLLRTAQEGLKLSELPRAIGLKDFNLGEVLAAVDDQVVYQDWAAVDAETGRRLPGRRFTLVSYQKPVPPFNPTTGLPSRPGEMVLAQQPSEPRPASVRRALSQRDLTGPNNVAGPVMFDGHANDRQIDDDDDNTVVVKTAPAMPDPDEAAYRSWQPTRSKPA